MKKRKPNSVSILENFGAKFDHDAGTTDADSRRSGRREHRPCLRRDVAICRQFTATRR